MAKEQRKKTGGQTTIAALLIAALIACTLSEAAGALWANPVGKPDGAYDGAYNPAEGLDPVLERFYEDDILQEEERAFLLSVTGMENEEAVFQYLTERGLNTAAACGVMANLVCESWGFNPINLEKRYEDTLGYTDESYTAAVDDGSYDNFVYDKAGYGICQWTYWSRKQALLEFAQERGSSIGDLDMQLDFMWRELSVSYRRLLNALKAVEESESGAYEAGYEFCVQFERPADMERMGELRGNLARDTYWREYGPEPTAAPTPEATVTPAPETSTEILSVQHSDSGVTVTAFCRQEDVEGAAIYCAGFNADQEMTAIQILPASAGTREYAFTLETDIDSVKIFFLDAAGRPLCPGAGGKP